jgi:molybdopterin converting factor subunit 1
MHQRDYITLLLFGWVREAAGANHIEIQNMHGRSVRELRLHLIKQLQLGDEINRCMVAINHKYALEDTLLNSSDEIALIPPVSGG